MIIRLSFFNNVLCITIIDTYRFSFILFYTLIIVKNEDVQELLKHFTDKHESERYLGVPKQVYDIGIRLYIDSLYLHYYCIGLCRSFRHRGTKEVVSELNLLKPVWNIR